MATATGKKVAEEELPAFGNLSIGEVIERMFEIRVRRQEISKEDKRLVKEWEGLEHHLMENLDSQGMTRASSRLGTATISETVLPKIQDWEQFEKYILENEALYMLQRRVSTGAYRELQTAGEEVPGIVPFTKRSIGLTSK